MELIGSPVLLYTQPEQGMVADNAEGQRPCGVVGVQEAAALLHNRSVM